MSAHITKSGAARTLASIRRPGHGGVVELVTIVILYVLTPVLLAVFTQRGALTLDGLFFAVGCAFPFLVLAWRGHLSAEWQTCVS